MIYVQHLLGVGHLQRSALLANALADKGFRVELVSGGMPHPLQLSNTVHLTQLPAARSPDSHFNRLIDDRDQVIDEPWKRNRERLLLDAFYRVAPQILITETYPFGRRMMRFELLPLLKAARQARNCLIVSSIRDILQPKSNPERNQEICDLIQKYYDHVLVHGDPKVAQLSDSFEMTDVIHEKLTYSGYISKPIADARSSAGKNEVLVSAGGSDTGLDILHVAMAARPLSRYAENNWRILVSPRISETEFNQLNNQAENGVIVERNRSDFTQRLQNAALSISQAGYNTITDLLSSPTPAVIVPFDESGEVEQSRRADLLQKKNRVICLPKSSLSAENLAQAINQASRLEYNLDTDLNGAANSAIILNKWLSMTSTEHA